MSHRPRPGVLSEDTIQTIRAGFEDSYRDASRTWLESPEGQAEVRREIVGKYDLCRRHVIPWVARVGRLRDATLIEIGCGTGAKSAAFAEQVSHVHACDLSPGHLAAARARTTAMGLTNVSLYEEDAATFLSRVRRSGPSRRVSDVRGAGAHDARRAPRGDAGAWSCFVRTGR